MDNPKCHIEMFENTPGNFLALPDIDLILLKRYVGRKHIVYCFTHDEAKELLKQRAPKLPDSNVRIPKNFLQSLQAYMATAEPAEQPEPEESKGFFQTLTEYIMPASDETKPASDTRGLSPAQFKDKYSDLGWTRGQQPEDYSDEFNTVKDTLEQVLIPKDWTIMLHKGYPGVEYDNEKCIEQQVVEDIVFLPETVENKKKSKMTRRRYPMVPMSLVRPNMVHSSELKWLRDDWDGEEYNYMDNDFKRHTFTDDDTKQKQELQSQIVDLLSGIYKIHLQPEPEYQTMVLDRIMDLISKDKVLEDNICSIKALIPYSRAVSDERIPAIVVYPVYGKESAQLVLSAITKALSDIPDVGMDITPRFNHRHNSLVYWASYDGSSKRGFREKYGEEEFSRVFEGPEFAYFICDDNKCHIENIDV